MDYYYHPASPNCRKVSALLQHLGLDAEWHLVELPKGEQASPEFLAINPNGKVPALVDGEQTLWESNAIAIHIAKKADSELWPDDEQQQTAVLRWLFWEQGHFMRATGIPFFERLIKPMMGGEANEAEIEGAVKTFRRLAKVLDAHLADHPYLVADRLTVADLAVASNLSFAEESGLPMSEFKSIQTWLERLDEMPAWKKSAPPIPG